MPLSKRILHTDIPLRCTFVGTNTGPEGTGKPLRFSGYEDWAFGNDGLVMQSSGHFDNDEYQYQLELGAE